MTVETLAQILNISRDSSGKYNISGLTEDEVWEAVTNYLGTSVTGTVGTVTPITESSTDILEIFEQGVEEYNEGETVLINYDGQSIPILDVIEKLGLSKNGTEYVVPPNLTDQDIIAALNSIISSTTTAS